jgi:outer membrane protein OmpA-like peptidoglycan-associated protein/tetratricopeptide (TPR) repeat protein
MKMKYTGLLLGALLFLGMLSSCTLLMGPVARGDRHLERGEFQPAIDNYLLALEKGKNSGKVNYNLAESYRLSNRIHQAAPYYQAADTLSTEEAALPVYYGQSLRANERYSEALGQFRRYLAEGDDRELLALARIESRGISQLSDVPDSTETIAIENLNTYNTAFPEYGPVLHKGYLYFTSSREGEETYLGTGTPFSKIYRSPFQTNTSDSTTAEPLNDWPTAVNINEGALAIHPNGSLMVFARGNDGKRKGAADVNLYISYWRDSVWSAPELMTINDPEAWDSTPAFSGDGKTLYFASNREGGVGGIDLYSARLDERGNWTGVRNMGSVINTPGNEMFPYVSPDEKLYFASDGHPGLGGLDLFVAERTEEEIIITSMGKPYNSNYDDFGIQFLNFPDEGLFTSNREGGQGDDDFYRFTRIVPVVVEKVITYLINGTTLQLNEDGTTEVLPNVALQLLDSAGNVVASSKSSPSGTYTFTVDPEKEYTILGEKPDFFAKRLNYSTKDKTVDPDSFEEETRNEIFELDVVLEPIVIDKAIVLENIYYDFDKAEIRDDAALELDKLVQIMRDNPGITIELSAHTDSRGSDSYNRDLSQRRAEAAVAYIVSKGINAERLEAKGYGASQPIAPNTNADGSDNPEGRQLNRRTEFKVIRQD